jgi:type IV pilus assembly protein PilQ
MAIFSRLKKCGPLMLVTAFVLVGLYSADTAFATQMFTQNFKPSSSQKLLSFYFQNIEIRPLLQLIAKNSGINFVISDAVKGSITLDLKDVTWQHALDIVLDSHGLASRRVGNVIYISTLEEMTATETKQFQSAEQVANLSPLTSTILHLKYTDAKELAKLLKGADSSLLTSRGQVAVDQRTNSLIIRDTKTSLKDIIASIKQLDVPARQVLIEARIVNINTNYEKQLGVRFGITSPQHLSGTLNGANQIVDGALTPAQITNGATIDPTQRLNFNNAAAAIGGATPGSIGLALARVGHVLLDLELSALEEEGHVEIISRPRVITSNQQKATIQTGTEIPYQEASSSGATSVSFKKAVLSLVIIPQITPDNKIVLRLRATQDTIGKQFVLQAGASTVMGPPSIDTQEVQSNILLNNNETIVLGGIYKNTRSSTIDRVPFLGELPIVGALFRHRAINNVKTEMLVFITPRILSSTSGAIMAKSELPK